MDFSARGQEHVPAPPAAVWAFLQDPERVARCLPDVEEIVGRGPAQAEATVRVSARRLRGRFRVTLDVQPREAEQRVTVEVRGGGLGSAVHLTAGATVRDNGDGTTALDWYGHAALRGPVAAVGGRALEARAQRLIAQTFQNLSSHLGAQAGTLA